ncbi:hypothetical protein PXK01_11000, partial [Phaeobacter sp. PT47_59]|uniref:hypothetical protein n=1 Tax=Phaeobacter sp. PT47_59 TaxID=3029979 RepID=UPI00237FD84A
IRHVYRSFFEPWIMPPTGNQWVLSLMSLGDEIAPRFQHRCVGPAVMTCDGQVIILPDMIANATIPPQHVWVDGWT